MPALAQDLPSCWSQGATLINFGTVLPDRPTDATSHATFHCTGGTPGYVRYCVYVAKGNVGGVAPRLLTNNNNSLMKYDIYADPARTLLVGLPPSEGGSSIGSYTGLLRIDGAWKQANAAIPLYGRAPAGQTLEATREYQAVINNSQIHWAFRPDRDPGTCNDLANKQQTFYLGVKAFYTNSCRVTAATKLDFGSKPSTYPELRSSSDITMQCPTGTAWLIGINNGLAGNRRMVSAAGNSIGYELYWDEAHKQRWGSIESGNALFGIGSGSAVVKVYGKVPAGSSPKGRYADTVTITLEF